MAKTNDEECIFLTRKRRKSWERGSYDYSVQGKAGYPPDVIHPISFINSKSIHFPAGFTLALQRGDERAMNQLRERAAKEGRFKDGVLVRRGDHYQVRRNYGGIGSMQTHARKLLLSSGRISTQASGFRVVIEDFEV